jgi:hypothetical protein
MHKAGSGLVICMKRRISGVAFLLDSLGTLQDLSLLLKRLIFPRPNIRTFDLGNLVLQQLTSALCLLPRERSQLLSFTIQFCHLALQVIAILEQVSIAV